MSNVTLLKRVRAIEKRLEPDIEPRQYSVILEEGEQLSEELRAQLKPYDTVIIRYYPKGFLGEDCKSTYGQVMSCWLPGPRGLRSPHFIRQYDVDITNV